MSKLEIRGYIAPADYDGDWAQPYIARGLWTPESKVRRDLAAASPDEPLTVLVSSPGGSVFAGYDMANAVRDWARETGQPVAVEVGALAASMGSYLGFFLSPDVSVHANTKAMFHGAATETWGGAQAHEDAAELLAQINGQIKGDLVAKGVPPETVDGWLAEGRMGWLNADQLMGYGMAKRVLDGNAPAERPDAKIMEQAMAAATLAQMPAIAAALAEWPEGEQEDERDESGDDAGEPDAVVDGAPESADAGGSDTEGEPPADPPAPDLGAEIDGLTDRLTAAAQAVADLTAERDALKAENAKHVEKYRELQGKKDKMADKLGALQTAHDELTAKLTRLVGTARAAPASNASAAMSWETARAELGYAEARRRFPGLHDEYERRKKTGLKAG